VSQVVCHALLPAVDDKEWGGYKNIMMYWDQVINFSIIIIIPLISVSSSPWYGDLRCITFDSRSKIKLTQF
jgi:hypothetical protein